MFPNLNMFTSKTESSSKPQEDPEISPPRRHLFQHYSPNIARANFENDMYQRKWSSNDLENYFNQMRLLPRPRDIGNKGLESRTKDICHSDESESPKTNTPMDTDESISGESFGTSSGNTLNSVNGSVGNTVPERNKVVLEKIRIGLDTRTTIMIKNVPNKYTQAKILFLTFD